MSAEAWNKITQTHELFKKIIAPLKEHLGINFGYMIVFNDGSYYQIIEDLECLKKWVTNVETSHIFCARNVTTYFDEPYNFTIWPEEPTCPAMEIYKEYGMWNGMTVSRQNKNYTELYWFTKQNAEIGWHKWFIRNKQLLHEILKYWNDSKYSLNSRIDKSLFRLSLGFEQTVIKSEYIKNDSVIVAGAIKSLHQKQIPAENISTKSNLSPREIEVLAIVGRGYSYKIVARKLSITPKTALNYIEHIKQKTGLHNKHELITLYEAYFLNSIADHPILE